MKHNQSVKRMIIGKCLNQSKNRNSIKQLKPLELTVDIYSTFDLNLKTQFTNLIYKFTNIYKYLQIRSIQASLSKNRPAISFKLKFKVQNSELFL